MSDTPPIYLLDVNVLVALGWADHIFHVRVLNWLNAQQAGSFATCSITELGFVRVIPRMPGLGASVDDARSLLTDMKHVWRQRYVFLADDHNISNLPPWVRSPRQITDGHLLELARAKKAILTTLDERIPGAFVIPNPK